MEEYKLTAKGVSVIVCCYNSSCYLPQTFKYLALQEVPEDIDWEVIIVNNASIDNTEKVALTEWKKYDLPNVEFKVLYEATPGLTNARKKGIEVSKFQYLIFCDDDNWLCKDYIHKVYNLFELMPEVGIIGGVGEAFFECAPPRWFLEMKGFGYAVGTEERDTGYVHSVYGAGMAIRKLILLSIIKEGISFVLTDRKGKTLSSGGDSEICLLIKLTGKKIYLDTSLTFKHFLPARRLTWQYYLKLRRSFGKANAYLQLYNYTLLLHSSSKQTNIFKEIFLLLKYSLHHFPYVLFPQFFKNSDCAQCVQESTVYLTNIFEFKKLQKVAYQLRLNFNKREFYL